MDDELENTKEELYVASSDKREIRYDDVARWRVRVGRSEKQNKQEAVSNGISKSKKKTTPKKRILMFVIIDVKKGRNVEETKAYIISY